MCMECISSMESCIHLVCICTFVNNGSWFKSVLEFSFIEGRPLECRHMASTYILSSSSSPDFKTLYFSISSNLVQNHHEVGLKLTWHGVIAALYFQNLEALHVFILFKCCLLFLIRSEFSTFQQY